MKPVIAIDGPAASGKGTLARRLAAHYALAYLDTGLTYRAVAKSLLDRGLPLDDETLAEDAARQVDFERLDRAALSTHGIGEAASRIAVFPAVRRILAERQRAFAARPEGAVLDGRDIGTVVCPHATVKLYVTASAEIRGARRHGEIVAAGGHAVLAEIVAGIRQRDARDAARADAPMRPAADAHLLDTSEMDIETAFRAARAIVDANLSRRG